MEEAVVVVAVAHEGMAARGVASRIDDRAPLVHLVGEERRPQVVAVILIIDMTYIAAILEIIAQGVLGTGDRRRAVFRHRGPFGESVGAAPADRRRAVLHLYRHPYMIHQLRHSVDLSITARIGEAVGHAAPSVCGGAVVGAEGAVGRVDVRMGAPARGGIVPVLHYLRGGGGHTAHHRMVEEGAVVRTETVVQLTLPPLGGNQRSHSGSQLRSWGDAIEKAGPPAANRVGLRGAARHPKGGRFLPAVAYLRLIILQPPPHIRRHILGLERATGGIAQDGAHAVVGGDDYKPPPLLYHKRVELTVRHRRRDVDQLDIPKALHPVKVGRHTSGSLAVHWCRHHSGTRKTSSH